VMLVMQMEQQWTRATAGTDSEKEKFLQSKRKGVQTGAQSRQATISRCAAEEPPQATTAAPGRHAARAAAWRPQRAAALTCCAPVTAPGRTPCFPRARQVAAPALRQLHRRTGHIDYGSSLVP